MPQFNGKISGFSNNSNLGLRWTVSGLPANVLIDSAEFIIKPTATSSDIDTVLSKVVDTNNVVGEGQVEDTGADGIGEVRFDLVPADTSLLTPYVEYTYWVNIILDTGETTLAETGTIFAVQGSSHA